MTNERLAEDDLNHMECVAQEMLPTTRRLTLAMVAEIREQRASLDETDRMALRWLRQFADGPARRVLDKLLGAGDGR